MNETIKCYQGTKGVGKIYMRTNDGCVEHEFQDDVEQRECLGKGPTLPEMDWAYGDDYEAKTCATYEFGPGTYHKCGTRSNSNDDWSFGNNLDNV